MLKLKNTQKGPRGVNTVSGPVLVEPDHTVEVEVYEREKEHLVATGWFDIKGTYKANPDGPATATSNVAGLAQRTAEIEKAFEEREAASRKAIEDAQKDADKAVADAKADADKALAEKEKEIADLKKQIETANKGGK